MSVVIVTGAAGGIARATAEAFAARGAELVLADIDGPGLDAVAGSLPVAVEAVVADVSTEGGAESVVRRGVERFGRLDVLANVVGGSRPGQRVTEVALDDWDAVVRLNLTSTYLMARFVIPVMERQGGGAIVNVSSGAGMTGMQANPAYCAAKAGVIGLTNALSIDHAPKGIRVNCVAPGAVLTPLMRRNRSEDEIAYIARQSLVGRVANPEEIAAVIVWLASDDASYVVGETIAVNGGRVAGV